MVSRHGRTLAARPLLLYHCCIHALRPLHVGYRLSCSCSCGSIHVHVHAHAHQSKSQSNRHARMYSYDNTYQKICPWRWPRSGRKGLGFLTNLNSTWRWLLFERAQVEVVPVATRQYRYIPLRFYYFPTHFIHESASVSRHHASPCGSFRYIKEMVVDVQKTHKKWNA